MNDNIRELAFDLNAEEVKRGKDFKGYKVFEPVYKNNVKIGLPYVIFVKDNKARICTDEEALDYIDFISEHKGE